jgi:phage recombination protein Bet
MTLATTQPRTDNLPTIRPPRLPYHPMLEERFGIDKASWKALVEAIFPNAQSVESVILALSYCRARKLDPFKRNVHIVPVYSKAAGGMIDTVWPGIGELRTTAFRTKQFAGRDQTQFGPDVTKTFGGKEYTFPQWAQVTVYRMVNDQRVAFAGPQVYWEETYATQRNDSDVPNQMWGDRPRGQIDKCAEAAALRAAFPEEIGTDYIGEEVQHAPKRITSAVVEPVKRGANALAEELKARNGQEPHADDGEPLPASESLDGSGAPIAGEVDTGTGEIADESQIGADDDAQEIEAPQQPELPATLPKAASGSQDWIDNAIAILKPEGMTAVHAREKFHKLDKDAWKLLGRARQAEKYVALKSGEIWNQ